MNKILIGVTGGIAAYKVVEVARLLLKSGYQVRFVMTNSAKQFITPTTLAAIANHPVYDDLFLNTVGDPMAHISLARWADQVLIAPASADFIAKLAYGFADDLLSTLCLATTAPIAIAPAMNKQMWEHAATQDNIQRLRDRELRILGPGRGEQACGEDGLGRLLEPDELLEEFLAGHAAPLTRCDLSQHRILITAGPTREALDPVRYLTNRSSGKMGYALAAAARHCGAQVTLISGPVNLSAPAGVTVHHVTSAQDMLACCLTHVDQHTIFIGAAAVADYQLQTVANQKIKKPDLTTPLNLTLIATPDIITTLAQRSPRPFMVGFAAETEHVLEHARQKLQKKHLDLIVANEVSATQGFDRDDNAVTVIWQEDECHLAQAPKRVLAYEILREIKKRL